MLMPYTALTHSVHAHFLASRLAHCIVLQLLTPDLLCCESILSCEFLYTNSECCSLSSPEFIVNDSVMAPVDKIRLYRQIMFLVVSSAARLK